MIYQADQIRYVITATGFMKDQRELDQMLEMLWAIRVLLPESARSQANPGKEQ